MNRTASNRATPLIIVVENSAAEADVVQRAFVAAEYDFEMKQAHSLTELRACLDGLTPDLVVSNSHLVDGRASDLVRMVRECPVIVISDHDSADVATEAMHAGAADFIVKSTGALLNLPLAANAALQRFQPQENGIAAEPVEKDERWSTIVNLARGLADRMNDALRPVVRECEAARDDVSRQAEAYWHLTSAIKAARESQDLAEQLLVATGSRVQPDASVKDVVRETVRVVRAAAPPSIAIRHVVSDFSHDIEIDGELIRHLIYSVCLELFDAMPAGGLIAVTMDEADDDVCASIVAGTGRYVRLSFHDSIGSAEPARVGAAQRTTDPREAREIAARVSAHVADEHGGAARYEQSESGGVLHVCLPIRR